MSAIWRRTERASIWLDACERTPEFLRRCFADVFASLDAHPRRLAVEVHIGSEGDGGAAISLVDGEPVFIIDGKGVANADFHKRWIAEHPVPLVLRRGGATRLVMEPTVGNRVKVRRARFGGLTLPPAFW